MDIDDPIKLPEGCRIVNIPCVTDERGALAFAQGSTEIPFDIARVFWIYNVPEGQCRGGHAHRECAEVVVPVHGAFTMKVDDSLERAEVRMDCPEKGILIPAGMWCELVDFEPDTVLVVMASEAYDAKGYVHSYADYIKEKKGC